MLLFLLVTPVSSYRNVALFDMAGCAPPAKLAMSVLSAEFLYDWGTAAAVLPPFRPSKPALLGSCPLVTPYYCRLGDLLCFMYVYRYSSLLLSMHVFFVLFPLFDLSFCRFSFSALILLVGSFDL